jgi:hypothetical protein
MQMKAVRWELRNALTSDGIAKPLANGTLGAGDTIDGFRVVSIEAKRIVIECSSVKLEIHSSVTK